MVWAPDTFISWLLIASIGLVLFGVLESLRIWRRERAPWVLAFTGLLFGMGVRFTLFFFASVYDRDVMHSVEWLQVATSLLAVISVVGIGHTLRASRQRSLETSRVRSALQEVGAAGAAAGDVNFFEHAAPRVTEILGAEASLILGFDRARSRLRILAVSIDGVLKHPESPTIEVEDPLSVDAPRTWMRALDQAFPDEPRFSDWSESELLALPLLGTDAEEHGVFAVYSRATRESSDQLVPALRILAGRAEDELQRLEREERLKKSEQRYRILFEESHEARYVCDLEGQVLDANRACVDLFGYESLDELLNSFNLIWHFPRDVRQRTQRGVLDSGSVADLEGQLRTRAGEVRYCVISARLGIEDDGRRTVRGSIRDVTEQRRLADQLTRSQRMETVGRMAGGVAHDFNNIIMVIDGATELLRTQHTDDEELQADVELIRSATRRAGAFTQRLLLLGRRREPTPEVLDLRDIVRDLENILSHAAGDAIHLRLELDDEPAWLVADPSQLEQVLLNLSVNARDAMPEGGTIDIRVQNRSRPDGDRAVHLTVEDSGVGVPSADFERIFEPFFSTKDASVGAGLGLTTVLNLVEALGGDIKLSSDEGKGARFDVMFPGHPGPSIQPRDKQPPARDGCERVLVVDDDPAVGTVLHRLLESMGYRVSVVSSGPEALTALRQQSEIELMITDVVMPEISGIELADQAQAERPGLKVLLISGYSEELLDVANDPNRAFLRKPLSRATLANQVRSLLDEAEEADLDGSDTARPEPGARAQRHR